MTTTPGGIRTPLSKIPTGVGGDDTTAFLGETTLTATGVSVVSSVASAVIFIPTAVSIACNLSWVV